MICFWRIPSLVSLVDSFHLAFFRGNHFDSMNDRNDTPASGRTFWQGAIFAANACLAFVLVSASKMAL
jgi:hypothetical protein